MPRFIPVDFDPFSEVNEIEKITFTNEPQREVWLSCIIGGDEANLSYNESVSLEIKGALNIESWRRAVDYLVLRHEALRATISPNGETLIIYRNVPVDFELQDISGLGESDRKKDFADFLRKEMDTPLNIQEGPLFRVFLHKMGEQEYYFTLIKHHIIVDGWSTGMMLEDLGKMYSAYVKGEDAELSRAAQISDYASAQASFKLTKAYKETEDYWLNLYRDNVPTLDLPTDRPRISPRSYKGNRIDHPLSKEMVDKLKAIGAKAGSSLVTTLLAAFEVFLYEKTRQRDLVVALPSSGQAATDMKTVVGHCVNLLPLKTYVDPSVSFTDYLKKRKSEVLDAYDHQRITFGELLKKLYIPRDPSRVALVPVMFNIDMGMDNGVSFEGLSYKIISNPRAYENFELYLNATGSKNGVILEWSYNTGLFDSTTIEQFHNDYYSILERIIADPATGIAELARDSEQSIVFASGNVVDVPLYTTINTLIAATVKSYPDKTAVSFNDTLVTYIQLSEQADQLAAFLAAQGITTGDIVAIYLDRSVEMPVCLLGILKAGAAYLPLDPDYPQDRIEFMLADSAAKLLLTSAKYKSRYKAGVKQVIVEEMWSGLDELQRQLPAKEVTGNDLAYVLYTSGSTGKPKGVKIAHANLVNFLLSMQETPGINREDKLLAITSISFDIAGLELYLPLITGAELVMADTEATKDGRLLLRLIEDKKITMMQATPSSWQMILDSGWQKKYPLKILSGGEPLYKDLADKLLDKCTELWNMYGPTETTIWSTLKQVTKQDKELTIGQPINNTTVYIMDAQGKPMPAGQQGEIYIGGAGVADGYLHRAELTAEKFVADTYSKVPGAKLYKTGDLGRILENGEVLCLGRIDHQVKIRGHRIELGEIETAIAKQNGVKQAVVLAREDTPNDKRLVAYVILSEDPIQSDAPSWKDTWDAMYDLGSGDKEISVTEQKIDGAWLRHLDNKEELAIQHEEWLRISTDRIKEIRAKRIYEIGSGAGQIMFELAADVEYYMATDYAQTAINNIHDRLRAEQGRWKHLNAAVASADDFSAIGDASVDLVLIHSVAQYFPDADYMIRVIRQAVDAVKNGGCVFVGDMQGMSSLEMYHAMDYLRRAEDTTAIDAFMAIVANRVRMEEELVADPAFFYLLPQLIPGITGVDVQLRKGQSQNETTNYHYDVWLYVGTSVELAKAQLTKDWQAIQTVEQLGELLTANVGVVTEVKNIPNIRTVRDHALLNLLHTADADMRLAEVKTKVAEAAGGMHPDQFWQLAAALNYDAHIRWTTDGTDGLFDVVFIPVSEKITVPEYSFNEVAGNDIYGFARKPVAKNEVYLSNDTIAAWRDNLAGVLPAYMVPDQFVALKSFPLTPNAKIDRKALPKPQQQKDTTVNKGRTVLTEQEQIVTDIWCDTLGLDQIDPSADFFRLGGHSLLAVKVMVAIENKTGKRLPIATLFTNSTIEKLAAQLSDDVPEKKWDVLVPIKTTGSKTPLFLIHGGGLNILLFKSISDYFDEEQPLYGIQALGLNHETDIPPTIEEIAARYINDIIEVHPDGPYAIAGYSLGGFLAFEIARQLTAMGKKIKFLGVMDTYTGNNYYVGGKVTRAVQKVKRQFRKVPFIAKTLLTHPKEAYQYQVAAATRTIKHFNSSELLIPKDTFTDYEVGIYRKYSHALDAYLLTPFDLKMTLFRVEKRLYFLDDLVYLGWDKFALRGVEIKQVPGDHETFLYAPNSEQFAHIIQKLLDES